MRMARISILGAGTWGIALARMLCLSGHQVQVWSALESEVEFFSKTLKHKNLPNVEIPSDVLFIKEIDKTCAGQDILVFAVPSLFIRSVAKKVAPYYTNQLIVSVAKGIENDTLLTMSEVITTEIGNAIVVVLSGPTHAEEVAVELPTTIVASSTDISAAIKIQELFANSYMRIYTNNDVKGVELCGALKNIIALASGIASGLGYGDNTKAALITRGLAEIEVLGMKMGCKMETFYGLAGIGDLIVTATSEHSRNYRCGQIIGQVIDVDTAIKQIGMVVEGINAIPAALSLAKLYEVELPIIEATNSIINGKINRQEIVQRLMERKNKSEYAQSVTYNKI